MSSPDSARTRVVAVTRADRDCPELDAVGDDADLVIVRTADELRRALPGVEVLFLNDVRSTLLREVGPGGLRWIHMSGIGVDALLTREIVSSGVTVTVSRGVCERPIAEWVLAALLVFMKDLRTTLEHQHLRRWVHRETEGMSGRRVLVLGPGPVGKEIVRLLSAVGMSVEVIGRRSRVEEGIGVVRGLDELNALLPDADDVVLALPLNASTRGLMSAERLGLMQRGARLVNVGRGGLVDERALVEALGDGRLGGAALDVFEVEPLPEDHPLWAMNNVIVSPHMSGDLVGWRDQVVQIFAGNLRRWRAGEALHHTVDLSLHPIEV